jgi:glycerol 3-phosphatase-1
MDGTLVDSTAAVIGAWETFADKYPAIDVQKILNGMSQSNSPHSPLSIGHHIDSHGVRTIDNLRKHCGIQDSEQLLVSAVSVSILIPLFNVH